MYLLLRQPRHPDSDQPHADPLCKKPVRPIQQLIRQKQRRRLDLPRPIRHGRKRQLSRVPVELVGFDLEGDRLPHKPGFLEPSRHFLRQHADHRHSVGRVILPVNVVGKSPLVGDAFGLLPLRRNRRSAYPIGAFPNVIAAFLPENGLEHRHIHGRGVPDRAHADQLQLLRSLLPAPVKGPDRQRPHLCRNFLRIERVRQVRFCKVTRHLCQKLVA